MYTYQIILENFKIMNKYPNFSFSKYLKGLFCLKQYPQICLEGGELINILKEI